MDLGAEPRQVLRIFRRSKKEFRENLKTVATSLSAAEILDTTAALAPDTEFDVLDAPEWAAELWEHLLTEWLRQPRGPPPPSARVAALLAAARRAAERGIPVSVDELEKSLEEVEGIGEEEI
ncbi:hypothetical protein Pyrfu_0530 [Pyrolobus fumarii 1A]|uniref:Uncharacterized protein n=1 Tax=Pyrolobus fumarii (strain DSM 11204 / 1A) TaxID=694429 RepID=G0EGM7_PYRF1|nr:hypothetical protein [Pyrolobus fumarii]AEM38401.1 hypothetical protein Pyrfu_0530 [Pyrolobus fumarii 1A]